MILAVTIFGGALIGGCGIKGPPVPPQRYRPAAVADLSYELIDDRAVLRWSVAGPGDQAARAAAGCAVYRARLALAGTDCTDCDASYKKVADVAVPGDATQQDLHQLRYVDSALAPGFEYAYRVRCSSAAGATSDESNVVRFEYRQPTTHQP